MVRAIRYVSKLKKCRTKSVDLRLPLFGISINSRGKRDFFPRLFLTMSVRSDNVERLGVVLYDNDIANGVQR